VLQFNVRPMAADIAARTADRRAAGGDLDGAIAALERSTDLWPAEPAYHQDLSWAHLQQASVESGDPLPSLEGAEAELLIARDLRPGDYRIWAALGELYGLWGNRLDAAKLASADNAYRQATTLAPNHATLYTAWGLIHQGAGQFTQAAAKFQQAVDLDATDGYAFSHLGDAELALGRVEEALVAYRSAAHWAPELSYAYLGLARCYEQLGQHQAAGSALQHALELDPDNPVVQAFYQQIVAAP
jgi:tetratricopeptide (TPR) repeat protein